jgi:hypothetical protein
MIGHFGGPSKTAGSRFEDHDDDQIVPVQIHTRKMSIYLMSIRSMSATRLSNSCWSVIARFRAARL